MNANLIRALGTYFNSIFSIVKEELWTFSSSGNFTHVVLGLLIAMGLTKITLIIIKRLMSSTR